MRISTGVTAIFWVAMIGVATAETPSNHSLVTALGACNNSIAQAYTSTTHGSTQINSMDFSYYNSPDCGDGSLARTINVGHGSLVLKPGAFFYCTQATGYSLGTTGCFNVAATVLSMTVTSITTNTGTYVPTGNCITLTCDGDRNFVSWANFSTNTMSL